MNSFVVLLTETNVALMIYFTLSTSNFDKMLMIWSVLSKKV